MLLLHTLRSAHSPHSHLLLLLTSFSDYLGQIVAKRNNWQEHNNIYLLGGAILIWCNGNKITYCDIEHAIVLHAPAEMAFIGVCRTRSAITLIAGTVAGAAFDFSPALYLSWSIATNVFRWYVVCMSTSKLRSQQQERWNGTTLTLGKTIGILNAPCLCQCALIPCVRCSLACNPLLPRLHNNK